MVKMVQFVSTKGHSEPVSFKTAMEQGLAPDGGLYVPDHIPKLPGSFWNSVETYSLQQIAEEVSRLFVGEDFPESALHDLVTRAMIFDAPVVHLEDNFYMLELFHGPTLAFKDFGARFMAHAFSSVQRDKERDLLVLVATSGDTGSAVAHGFYGVPGTSVCLLYPSGKVSPLQEKQMTTLGGNVTALEVEGTFDDCQSLVKQAFSDKALNVILRLSSANSINIARLLPQSFYYIHAYAEMRRMFGPDIRPVFSVPSGNFGNLTGGLLAMKMGMPVERFLAATNSNNVVPEYLKQGVFAPRPSVQTISNAMDVGNPSNFDRILNFFNQSLPEIREQLWGISFDDDATRACIRETFKKSQYILDPHSAIGVLAAQAYKERTDSVSPVIILSTAHPSKFSSIVEDEIEQDLDIPHRLKKYMNEQKKSFRVNKDYETFKNVLLEKFSN